jgi:Holliday junction resolvase
MTEKELQKQVEDYLRARGWFVWRSPHVPRRPGHNSQGTKGEPDIKALKFGNFLAVETKSKGKKATDEQELFIAGIEAHGGRAVVVYELQDLVTIKGGL